MADEAHRIERLLDRAEIEEVLYRYCRGADRLDVDAIRSCYHPDATHDHGMFKGSAVEFIDYSLRGLASMKRTLHCISNINLEFRDETAISEAYGVAYHRVNSRDSGEADHTVWYRYLDRFERRRGSWLIAARTVVYEWSRIDPVGREWAMPDEWHRGRRDRSDMRYRLIAQMDESMDGA